MPKDTDRYSQILAFTKKPSSSKNQLIVTDEKKDLAALIAGNIEGVPGYFNEISLRYPV
jgi:hypothetical protein